MRRNHSFEFKWQKRKTEIILFRFFRLCKTLWCPVVPVVVYVPLQLFDCCDGIGGSEIRGERYENASFEFRAMCSRAVVLAVVAHRIPSNGNCFIKHRKQWSTLKAKWNESKQSYVCFCLQLLDVPCTCERCCILPFEANQVEHLKRSTNDIVHRTQQQQQRLQQQRQPPRNIYKNKNRNEPFYIPFGNK